MVMAEALMTSPTSSPVKNDHSSRKSKKPLMEKRRRARINSSLSQLKALVLQASNRESSQYSKLEKADILEMTVHHMRELQKPGGTVRNHHIVSKYRAGFSECFQEVSRYIQSVPVTSEVKSRLLGHLSGCLKSVEQSGHVEPPVPPHHHHLPPLHLRLAAQPVIDRGVLMHAPTASAFQAGLNFAVPSAHGSVPDGSMTSLLPSVVAPVPTLPPKPLSAGTTSSSAVIPAKPSAFQAVARSGGGEAAAAYVTGSSSSSSSFSSSSSSSSSSASASPPSSSSSITTALPGSVASSVSATPARSFTVPADTQGSAAAAVILPAASSSPVPEVASSVETSSVTKETLKQASRTHADSAASVSALGVANTLWRPW